MCIYVCKFINSLSDNAPFNILSHTGPRHTLDLDILMKYCQMLPQVLGDIFGCKICGWWFDESIYQIRGHLGLLSNVTTGTRGYFSGYKICGWWFWLSLFARLEVILGMLLPILSRIDHSFLSPHLTLAPSCWYHSGCPFSKWRGHLFRNLSCYPYVPW